MSQIYWFGPQLLPIALLLAAAVVAAHWPPGSWNRLDALARGALAPWIAGTISAVALGIVWGSLSPVATIHDETAYLLEARLLAAGHLIGPGRPLPEFFEQFHVFVTPVLAAKYPLGFALALVPGLWLGLPALMPLLLNGIAGGLLFALARRLTSPAVAALAWLLWLLAPGTITYHTAYLSETLSGPLWLAAWWALLEWRALGQRRWLVALAVAIAACAITRPLTAVGLALPCGIVVLIGVVRQRRGADLAVAAVAGLLVISPLFYQNARVTGDWRVTPWERYADIYAPVDRPGFTIDGRPPQRELPEDMRAYVVYFTQAHIGFQPSRLPGIFLARAGQVLRDAWGEWRLVLGLFALLGLLAAGREPWFGIGSLLSLMAVHLIFAHPLNWSLYYQEGQPALALVTALGIASAAQALARRMARPEMPARGTLAIWLMVLAALGTGVPVLTAAREKRTKDAHYHEAFRALVAALPGRSIVFVRYSPIHKFYTSLIDNPPDLEGAPYWIVHDLESENPRLMALAPDRTPYLYIEQKKLMVPLSPDGTPAASPASAQ
jgi:hypothetical protein